MLLTAITVVLMHTKAGKAHVKRVIPVTDIDTVLLNPQTGQLLISTANDLEASLLLQWTNAPGNAPRDPLDFIKSLAKLYRVRVKSELKAFTVTTDVAQYAKSGVKREPREAVSKAMETFVADTNSETPQLAASVASLEASGSTSGGMSRQNSVSQMSRHGSLSGSRVGGGSPRSSGGSSRLDELSTPRSRVQNDPVVNVARRGEVVRNLIPPPPAPHQHVFAGALRPLPPISDSRNSAAPFQLSQAIFEGDEPRAGLLRAMGGGSLTGRHPATPVRESPFVPIRRLGRRDGLADITASPGGFEGEHAASPMGGTHFGQGGISPIVV